ncbi:MAG TPA: cobalt-precorrin-6A reductase [Stellaceae bacterium]|jgi:precorrin-6A/cobalt-precorrin-6A reductase|nr:cobalt-precorrin-6A reductase [Stellaceae bacterium]
MPARDATAQLLILGGTAEAAALAVETLRRFGAAVSVTTALAGRTEHPAPLPGRVRLGGFGGAEGLAAYLAAEGVDCLIDATHPFAAQISAQAAAAADAAGVPRLVLWRPPWQRHPLDRWIEVGDLAGAADVLPRLGRRVFLTVGRRELGAFAALTQHHFLVRLVDPPDAPLPLASAELLLRRGPFNLAEERRILERHAIEVLVAKASGGEATEPKLIAARERGLPVVMVRRPSPPPGERVESVAAALDWLAGRLDRPARASEERG